MPAEDLIAESEARTPRRATAVYMSLVGGNEFAASSGSGRLEHRTNYFRGSEENWRTEIPNYAEVRFDGVYPGVDVVWRGNGAGDAVAGLTVEPFADVSQIAWEVAGADDVRVTDSGELLIRTEFGDIVRPAPQAFQQADGFRAEVDIAYDVSQTEAGRFRVGYRVGEFDRGRAFEIGSAPKDVPTTNELSTLGYSTYLGGGSNDGGTKIAVDGAGNTFVVGNSISSDFPTTAGSFDPSINGSEDAFVTKLNAAGSGLVYSTFLGGFALERAFGIAVDSTGNAFVAGRTDSSNFPTTTGAYNTSHNGGPDIFVTKLNAAGSGLVYSTFIGGSGNDFHNALAVDSAGNAYVAGVTQSTNYPTTSGAYDTSYNGTGDVFVTKLNAAGSGLDYSTFIGDSGDDGGTGIAVDSAGNAFVAGYTNSIAFPTTTGAYDTSHNGSYDAFVTQLNAAGSGLVYSTFLGGSGSDGGNSIAVDGSGNAYVTGNTSSTGFPTTAGAFDTSHNGGQDVFVTKLNAAGSALLYSTFIGGGLNEEARGIEIDSAGNAFITGGTESTGFPITGGAFDPTHNGESDVFFTKLNPTGSGLLYSTFIGGFGGEGGNGITIDSTGNTYITGFTRSSDFPTTAGAFDVTYNGNNDVFVTKLAPPPPTAAQVSIGGRVFDDNGFGVRNATVTLVQADGTTLTTQTSSFGYYTFEGVEAGQTAVIAVRSRTRRYAPVMITVSEDLTGVNFYPSQ